MLTRLQAASIGFSCYNGIDPQPQLRSGRISRIIDSVACARDSNSNLQRDWESQRKYQDLPHYEIDLDESRHSLPTIAFSPLENSS